MQDTKTQNTTMHHQGKLSLKTSNSRRSSQHISSSDAKATFENAQQHPNFSSNQTIHKENIKSNSKDESMEDSLADFKSPKQKIVHNLNNCKAGVKKAKRTTRSKSNFAIKSKKSNTNLPSIELSLLKPQTTNQTQTDIKEAVTCPVCLKPFRDDSSCTNHMKSCAAKNSVSTKQLLEAKRLQDRQAQERKAIGLLAAPIIQERKKAFQSKNFSTADDPQLQLVLAMSESLYEAERMVQLEEAAFLAGIPSECIREMNDEERKRTLKNFGFTTNKPIANVPTNKQRKKKLLTPTILQSRSKEDKDRVLTERIACILTGEDAFTQAQGHATISFESETPTIITSKLLSEIEEKDNKLWDQSRLTKQHQDFYVVTLKSYFAKFVQQPVESKTHECLVEISDKQFTPTINTSHMYESMDLDMVINDQQVEQNDSNYKILSMNELQSNNCELKSVQCFCDSWRDALNDSSASDVVIFVKNNKHIYAHKLVFHVQCSNILLDMKPLDEDVYSPIRRKICWLDIEQISALAFLEFIYSGAISKYLNIFEQEELVRQVEQLGRLYKKQSLFTYIKNKQQHLKFQRKDSGQLRSSNDMLEKKYTDSQLIHSESVQNSDKNLKSADNIFFELQVTHNKPYIDNDGSVNKLTQRRLAPDNPLSVDRQITASPDLFDSDEDGADNSKIKVVNNSSRLENKVSTCDGNVKKEIDHVQDSDHLSAQEMIVNLSSRSVSPLEDIHEAITPPSGRSPRDINLFEESPIFNEQEIAEAITPKRQSPETIVGIKQEIFKRDNLDRAVTPEYTLPAQMNNCVTPKKWAYASPELRNAVTEDHIDESIYTAVTPPKQQEEPAKSEDAHRVKSELTIFIEKVQRRNAKHIMDTDSETDTPHNQARHKNPFLKRDQDGSYGYLKSKGDQKCRRAISLLEKDVLDDEKVKESHEIAEVDLNGSSKNRSDGIDSFGPSTSSRSNIQNSPKDNISLPDDEIQGITVDENEMSMYTKYKISNKRDNSIAYYRKQLNFNGRKIHTDDKAYTDFNAEETFIDDSTLSKLFATSVSQSVKNSKPRIIEDITLVSDSDEEDSPLRTFIRDKSKKKIDRGSPGLELDKKDTKVNLQTLVSNIENHDKFLFKSVNKPLEPNKNYSKVFIPAALRATKSRDEIIELSLDSDEDGNYDDSNFPNNSVARLDNTLNISKSFTMDLETTKSKQKVLEEAEKKSEDIDAVISKILETSQRGSSIIVDKITISNNSSNSNNTNNNDEEQNIDAKEESHENKINCSSVRDICSGRKTVNLSPISIGSSPEHCELSKSASHGSKSNVIDKNFNNSTVSQNIEGSLALGENGDFDSLAFNNWDVKTPPKEIVGFVKSLRESARACTPVKKLTYDELCPNSVESGYLNELTNPKNKETSALISSPILSQNRRSLLGSQGKCSTVRDSLRKKGRSPEYNPEDSRQLKKSASTSSLTEKLKGRSGCNLLRSSSFVTPEQNKKASRNHGDITPPLDYSLLDTPVLQNELRKFGFKPQNRTKAKVLLKHIYKETHSTPTSTSLKRMSNTDSSSDESEPPAKRQFVEKTSEKPNAKNKENSRTEERRENCLVIAEEMDFDDPDVASIFQNPVSIKDAFFNLLKTNGGLYNKVLTYEPLPLEALHLILKQNGFKCKINDLMDFLDEQCITFQVKTNKIDRMKIKIT